MRTLSLGPQRPDTALPEGDETVERNGRLIRVLTANVEVAKRYDGTSRIKEHFATGKHSRYFCDCERQLRRNPAADAYLRGQRNQVLGSWNRSSDINQHSRKLGSYRDKNKGMGIAEENLPHLFERFYRADKARSREMGGAGLGLSIAKWIADSHRAQIKVESVLGKGSTFKAVFGSDDLFVEKKCK